MKNAAICRPLLWWWHRHFKNALLIMKLTTVLLMAGLLQVHAAGYSQTITLAGKDMPLKEVFAVIKKQTGYVAFYNKSTLEAAKPVSCSVQNMPLQEFLQQTLKDQPFTFQIADRTILVSPKPVAPMEADTSKPQNNTPMAGIIPLHGRVVDKNGEGLAGVSISLRGTKFVWMTKPDGTFTALLQETVIGTHQILAFTSVGYSTRLQVFPAAGKFMLDRKSVV